jgi:predicted PurR-regulated permease PerM
MHRRVWPLPKQSQVFFFIILGLMLFLTWMVFSDFIIYIITGVFVAVLAQPIDKFFERFVPNRVAAIFTMTTLLVIITVPLVFLGIAMYNDASRLADGVASGEFEGLVNATLDKGWAKRLLAYGYPNIEPEMRVEAFHRQVGELQDEVTRLLEAFGNNLLTAAPDFFIGLTVILFVVYYVLTDGETFIAYLRRAAPLPGRQVDYLLQEARQGLSAVFMGQIFVSALQGALGGIGFAIAGLPNAVLWGSVMAILALLPVVGTFLIWVPGAIWLIITGHVGAGIFLLVWGVVVVIVIADTLIKPKLIGSRADIHPMFVLVGVLGGAAAFGFVGLFLGPLLVGVTIAVLKVYEQDYLDPDVNLLDEYVGSHGPPDGEPADPDTAPATPPQG